MSRTAAWAALALAATAGGCIPAPPRIEPTTEGIARRCGVRPGSGVEIDREQARCIARRAGLARGLEAWRFERGVDPRTGRPIWRVENVLRRNEFVARGHWVAIDRADGRVIAAGAWTRRLPG